MKIFLTLFAFMLYAPCVWAQAGGFFIPQKTVEMMRNPQPKYTPANRLRTATPAVPKATPSAVQPRPTTTQSAVKSENPSLSPADADIKKPQSNELHEMMVPQTGTPAVPVTADDAANIAADDNSEAPSTENISTDTADETDEDVDTTKDRKGELSFDDIINEYRNDIKKIGKNLPAENQRLDEVLKNYKDEILTY